MFPPENANDLGETEDEWIEDKKEKKKQREKQSVGVRGEKEREKVGEGENRGLMSEIISKQLERGRQGEQDGGGGREGERI